MLVVPKASAQGVVHWRTYTQEAAQRFGIPAAWIERVMHAESGGETRLRGRLIRSPKGAMGLMQLMPGTWAEMRAAHGLGDDPFDPRDNILAGAAYLRRMYDRFGYPGMFAAYNAGPGRYAAYLAGEQRLPGETIDYLAAVTGTASKLGQGQVTRVPAPLFVALRTSGDGGVSFAGPPASDALFFVRKP
jgi:soluble lytic murein transglycosylase-like protein